MMVRSKYSDSKLMEIRETTLPEARNIIQRSTDSYRELQEMPGFRIYDSLFDISEALERDSSSLSETIAQETGKPVKLAREEVEVASQLFREAAEEAKNRHGTTLSMDWDKSGLNRTAYSSWISSGPLLYLYSYHSPLLSASLRAAAALASRNSVILKPSSQAPVSSKMLVDLGSRSDFPAGSLQAAFTPGFGNVTKFLVDSREVKVLAFSGNWSTANRISSIAGIKKYIMEIYGNATAIVWNDADLDTAAEQIVRSAFVTSTHTGHHLQRILIHTEAYEYFKNRIAEVASHLRCGDPMDAETDIGPMISTEEADSTQNIINLASSLGGTVILGGKREGNVVQPTLIEGISTSSYLWNNDVPGALVLINPISSMAEAVKTANECSSGLYTGLFTADLNLALFAGERLQTPMIVVNDYPDFLPAKLPLSGTGKNWTFRNGVSYLMDEMSGTREMMIKR